ncbi:MAG: ribonuclease HII [Candidatus Colwellbacteria bacterium]|nr:ribonuclease HII [Candidatus Colwellbacteria bacterium]
MYTIGIDEVGRGSLAGPVVVAAVLLPRGWRPRRILKDSKRMTPAAREMWFEYLKSSGISYSTARVYPKGIDRLNISNAANLAATRAFQKLIDCSFAGLETSEYCVVLDGGLYLSSNVPILKMRTVIKGDEKFNCIKLASIMAKVTRDRYMVKLHEAYPDYGFKKHKGYGTEYHIKAVKKYGYSDVHRRSFKVKGAQSII